MARRMREFDLTWLEEPVAPPGDHAGLARVRRDGAMVVVGMLVGGDEAVRYRIVSRTLSGCGWKTPRWRNRK